LNALVLDLCNSFSFRTALHLRRARCPISRESLSAPPQKELARTVQLPIPANLNLFFIFFFFFELDCGVSPPQQEKSSSGYNHTKISPSLLNLHGFLGGSPLASFFSNSPSPQCPFSHAPPRFSIAGETPFYFSLYIFEGPPKVSPRSCPFRSSSEIHSARSSILAGRFLDYFICVVFSSVNLNRADFSL